MPVNYSELDVKIIMEEIKEKLESTEVIVERFGLNLNVLHIFPFFQLEYPEYFELELLDLVEKLLQISPSVRLGSLDPVRNHDFFYQVCFYKRHTSTHHTRY